MPPETDQTAVNDPGPVIDPTQPLPPPDHPPPSVYDEEPPVEAAEDDEEPAQPPLEVDHDLVVRTAHRAFPGIDWDSQDHDALVEQTNAIDETERVIRIMMAVSIER